MILAKFGPNRTIGSKVMGEKFNPAYFHQETYYTLGFAKFAPKVRRTSNPKILAELSNPNPNLKTTNFYTYSYISYHNSMPVSRDCHHISKVVQIPYSYGDSPNCVTVCQYLVVTTILYLFPILPRPIRDFIVMVTVQNMSLYFYTWLWDLSPQF